MDLSHIVRAIAATNQQPIQGLIGQDVMRDQQAIIDVEHSVLYLKTVDGLDADIGPCDEDAPQPETAVAQAGNSRILETPRTGSWRMAARGRSGKRSARKSIRLNTRHSCAPRMLPATWKKKNY